MDKQTRTEIGGNEMKIYHTETQADYDSLMVELEEQGAKWFLATNPTESNNWPEFEHQTGIKVQDCMLTYHGVEYFERANPETPIIKYTVTDKTEPVYIDIDVTKITVDETHSISFEDAMALVENKVDDIADKRYEKHRDLVDELHKIYVAKNKDYGNSFGESIDEFGIIAGVVRIGDKYNRLKTLAKGHEPLVNDETMVDTLKDMANYCLLTVIELEGK